ncbi:MAG TPA: hypothetical protein VFY17_06015 [Pilimelia sp.]|nr:hypothetical protein [Pilimelia sp.]
MTAAVKVEDLRRTYRRRGRRRPAPADIPTTVEAGQVHGFLGPHGSGKTTTLRGGEARRRRPACATAGRRAYPTREVVWYDAAVVCGAGPAVLILMVVATVRRREIT